MTRRLFYLNALLVVITIVFGLRLRMMAVDAGEREEVVRLDEVQRLHYSPQPPPPRVQAVNAVTYSDVAIRMLFSRDRNPVEIRPDELPPPPPPPPPPFPKANGVMMWGDRPLVILSTRGSEGQKIYKFGDKVGEWEIAKFDSKTITLKWMDKEFTKELADLVDNNSMAPAVQASPPPRTSDVRDIGHPEADLGNGTRSCVPSDPSPNGAIVNGMRKVSVASPFGNKCHWEPVK
jgi:hypothetical protein